MYKPVYNLIITLFLMCLPAQIYAQGQDISKNPNPRDVKTFRIASGTPGGTYFVMGSLIAHGISRASGSRSCDRGGSCGIDGLEAIAISSYGSIHNIQKLYDQEVEAAIAQADSVYMAYHGLDDAQEFSDLRILAYLWPEDLHILSHAFVPLTSLEEDLKGRKVSIGSQGSGTLKNNLYLFEELGIKSQDYTPIYHSAPASAELLHQQQIDITMHYIGWPVRSFDVLLESHNAQLNSLEPKFADIMVERFPWMSHRVIPKEAYGLDQDVSTIGLYAVLVVPASLDDDFVYQLTEALWNPSSLEIYERGFQGRQLMQLSRQWEGNLIPFHPGAKKWYNEAQQKIMGDHKGH